MGKKIMEFCFNEGVGAMRSRVFESFFFASWATITSHPQVLLPLLMTLKSIFQRCFAPWTSTPFQAGAQRPFDWPLSPQRGGERQTFPRNFVFECRVLGVLSLFSRALEGVMCCERDLCVCVLTCSGKVLRLFLLCDGWTACLVVCVCVWAGNSGLVSHSSLYRCFLYHSSENSKL